MNEVENSVIERIESAKRRPAEFHVMETVFGYKVTPPRGLLWLPTADSKGEITIHNRTNVSLIVEVVEPGVRVVPESVTIDATGDATMTVEGRPSGVTEFDVLIWCVADSCPLFRAEADSDPRIVVLPQRTA